MVESACSTDSRNTSLTAASAHPLVSSGTFCSLSLKPFRGGLTTVKPGTGQGAGTRAAAALPDITGTAKPALPAGEMITVPVAKLRELAEGLTAGNADVVLASHSPHATCHSSHNQRSDPRSPTSDLRLADEARV